MDTSALVPLLQADDVSDIIDVCYDATDEMEDASSGYESSDTTENEAFKPRTPRDGPTSGEFRQSGKFHQSKGSSLKFKSTRMLCEDLKLILDMPEMCDVTFLVGPKEVPVHAVRAILGTRSKVFYQLILQHLQIRAKNSGDKKRRFQCDRLYIPVRKYDSEIFRMLLQFVHCGTVTITAANVTGLLCGANQFQLDDLEDACWEYIRQCLVSGRGETLLKPARLYKHFRVTDIILKEIYAVLDRRFQTKNQFESTV